MKYTKKVPYFKEGDKIDKAARNLPKKQREAVLKVSSAQKEQERKDKLSSVGAGFKKPTAEIIAPADTRSKQIKSTVAEIKRAPVKKSLDELSFGEAFNRSHKEGLKVFEWRGKKYTTRTAEEEAALRSGDTNTEDKSSSVDKLNAGWGVLKSDQQKSETPDNTQKTNATNTAEDEVTKIRDTSLYSGPSIWIDRDKIRNIPQNLRNSGEAAQQFFDGVNLMYEDFGKTTPGKIMNNPTQSQHLLGALPLILWGKIKKHTNPMFQQGGTINKFQRGNVLTNREQHLVDVSRLPKLSIPQVWGRKLFGTGPKPVETGRTHLNKAGEQVPEVGNRIIMPGGRDNTTITRGTNYGSGWLTSQRNIQRGDTTYVTPGGNAPSAADLPRYKSVFDNADRAIWKSRGYQQGGQVEQQPQMTEEDLIMDFTVRYLSALGVAPEEIMDQEGNLNPTYVEEITNVFQQGDIDWESYMASPDEYIQQFVGSRMQMAKKGAKLKRLSQLRIYKK